MNYTDIASVIKGSIDDIVGGGRPEDSIPVKDFIYRGNGTTGSITAISTRDQFFGAMPGGPIDTAMKAVGIANGVRGGAVGGPSRASAGPTNVVVNINGGDLGKVYEVVRNVLQQSGLRPPAGAYAG